MSTPLGGPLLELGNAREDAGGDWILVKEKPDPLGKDQRVLPEPVQADLQQARHAGRARADYGKKKAAP